MDIDIRKTVTDAAYITVGIGVLGFQQAQVRRREVSKAVGSSVEELSKSLGSSVDEVSRAVGSSVDELRTRIEPVLEHIQCLPGQVREAAEAGRDRIGGFVEARWPLSPPN
ncbi:MAG: hypothetical protein KJ056_07720 [Acidimicrobiia bacterium]|nr:hypothetical protein [Acidimicrobiia bacterium]MCL4292905.1 hypothetical protein [Acidimicrobiia bacterium]